MKTIQQTLQKLIVLCVFASLATTMLRSQVTIGSSLVPSKAALLDLKQSDSSSGGADSNLGLAMPRVNLTDLNKLYPMFTSGYDPAMNLINKGLTVYNVNSVAPFQEGMYIWDGLKWNKLGAGATTDPGLWLNDDINSTIKLGVLSDGVTTRPANTQFVAKDNGSVGIGTSTPNTSAILDLNATDKGLLIPRVALTDPTDQVTVPNPTTGLMVFNTGTAGLQFAGLVFWNGTEWRSFSNASSVNPTITGLNCGAAYTTPTYFSAGLPYSGVLNIPYDGGNGGSYLTSDKFTQNGLTFTKNIGTLNSGSGIVSYTISGTPDFTSPNTKSIPISFLGNSCNANIGAESTDFIVGQTKSVRFVVNKTAFAVSAAPQNKVMSGRSFSNTSTTSSKSAFDVSNAADRSRFFILNGLRMDFLYLNNESVIPKLYNATSSNIVYSLSALSTNDKNSAYGPNMEILPGYYCYAVDGDNNMSAGYNSQIEYNNVMLSFPNGQWYNCTWYVNYDATNYYFYMTAQRLN